MKIFVTNDWYWDKHRIKINYGRIRHWFGVTTITNIAKVRPILEIHVYVLNFGIHIICEE